MMNNRSPANTTTKEKPSVMPIRSSLLQRKCACGNSAGMAGECSDCQKKSLVQREEIDRDKTSETAPISHEFPIQTKLTVGKQGDIYEQEADRVADRVMAASPNSVVSSAPLSIQRFTGQTDGQAGMVAPASVDSVLSSPGIPLEAGLQQDMGQRFGHDFSRVRVHTDAAADRSAQAVNAHAYTVGHNIVFATDRFAPGTHKGRRLIAHELTHVIQQLPSPQSLVLRREPSTLMNVSNKPPVPNPGHTPFNYISESPALENWKVSVKKMLERNFKMKFSTFEEAQEHFRLYLQRLPSNNARENFADRMRDRARKAFYRQEARNPSYAYDETQLAKLRNGSAPVAEMQLEHMEEVKSKNLGGQSIQGYPERALDPSNIYVTEGGPGGTTPIGTKHAEKQRTINASQETSRRIRAGKVPSAAPYADTMASSTGSPQTQGTPRPSNATPAEPPVVTTRPPVETQNVTPSETHITEVGATPKVIPRSAPISEPSVSQSEDFVSEIAHSGNAVIKKQGGFATIEGQLYAVLSIGTVFLLVHSIKSQGILKTANDLAISYTLERAIMHFAKVSARVSSVITILIFMESDSVKHDEEKARVMVINNLIHESYPEVLSKERYCLYLTTWPCTDWKFEVKDEKKYNEIYPKIKYLTDNPHVLEKTQPTRKMSLPKDFPGIEVCSEMESNGYQDPRCSYVEDVEETQTRGVRSLSIPQGFSDQDKRID